jgi:hypothetical protein
MHLHALTLALLKTSQAPAPSARAPRAYMYM